MNSVKLGGGFNYTIDAPQFDKTVDLGNGVVHFKEDYRFQMEGDDYDSRDDHKSNGDEHLFQPGDLIGVVNNYDWHDFLAEFAGEIEIKEPTKAYYDDYGSVSILFTDKVICLSGEFCPFDQDAVDILNTSFNKNYKVIFFTGS